MKTTWPEEILKEARKETIKIKIKKLEEEMKMEQLQEKWEK